MFTAARFVIIFSDWKGVQGTYMIDVFGERVEDTNLYSYIHFNIPEVFYDECLSRINSGIDEGIQKWGVYVTDSDRESVIYHSINQVQDAVAQYSFGFWDYTDSELLVRVKSDGLLPPHVYLPEGAAKVSCSFIVRPREILVTEETEGDSIVSASELHGVMTEKFYGLSSVAGFYGVASLKNKEYQR